jgi:TetR/AcrR family transcriptional repressor of nem operon
MSRKPSYDRDDVIRRACYMFWKRGWAGTSLKDLEVTLNLNPGSFYAAFGSKDALYKLTLDQYVADNLATLTELEQTHGPLGALKAFLHHVIQDKTAAAQACMLSKTVLELSTHAHPLADHANELLEGVEKDYSKLFDKAQARDLIGAVHDPRSLARRYMSDLLGMRISAERSGYDASATAYEIEKSLSRL